MLKRLNKFLYSSIVISILMLIIGLTFIIFPEVSFKTITYILSFALIINGIYFIAQKELNLFFSNLSTLGIVELLLGVVLLLKPDLVKTLFPIVAGIIMVTKSTMDLRLSILLKKNEYSSWLYIFICSVISIVCGLIIIINPNIGTIALTLSLGILITLYSVSNIVDTIMFKKNVDNIVKILDRK